MDLCLQSADTDLSLTELLRKDMPDQYPYMTEMNEFSSVLDLESMPLFDIYTDNFSHFNDPLYDSLDGIGSGTPPTDSCGSSASSLDDDTGSMALENNVLSLDSWNNSNDSYTFELENGYACFVDPSSILPSSLGSRSNSFDNSRQIKNTSPPLSSTPMFTSISSSGYRIDTKPHSPLNSLVSRSTNTLPNPTSIYTVKHEPMEVTIKDEPIEPLNNARVSNNNVTVIRPSQQFQLTPQRVPQPRPVVTTMLQPTQVITTSAVQSQNFTTIPGHIFRSKQTTVRVTPARKPDDRGLPKPAYSYSCLIALALKNSTTGCLPVSEIYAFMCEHFPYFRKAPNGWKNSVRHNLSLNKCFEKIEKPVGNNQRKGCLWALNPNKSHKMDEEIQKWNKKDLQGIKDAMSMPEVLGALERGEMKFESSVSTCPSSEDDDTDSEEQPEERLLPPAPIHNTIRMVATLPNMRGPVTTTQVLQSRPIQTLNSKQPAILRHQNKIKTLICNISPSPYTTPEYILPDTSDMTFSSGDPRLVDSEDHRDRNGVVTVGSSTVSASGLPRGMVLKKLSTGGLSPVIYRPIQGHAGNLNRLVLTNAKLA